MRQDAKRTPHLRRNFKVLLALRRKQLLPCELDPEAPMKAILVAASLCLIAAEAHAISRYDPTRMSCGEVQARVARDGAALLRYRSPRNPSITLYDRYVRDDRFCDMGEVRSRAFVPSADRNSCQVYKCERPEYEERWRRIWPD